MTSQDETRHAFDSVPESIRRVIEARITDNQLDPGHRLGLKSELQREFSVAGPTIDQALKLLVNDGMISIRRGPGGGVFVERSQPLMRLGSKQLWARDVESVTENIELREALTPLLGVSAARAQPRDPDKVQELGGLATALRDQGTSFEPQRMMSFETQRMIWRGDRLLAELADNETLRFIYVSLLDAVEASITKVELPDSGPAVEREIQRIDAYAGLFRAVVAGDVAAAETFGETVVSVESASPKPARLRSTDDPSVIDGTSPDGSSVGATPDRPS